jgi:hypothetical protein
MTQILRRYAPVNTLLWTVLSAATGSAVETRFEPWRDPGVGFNLISWWNFGSQGSSMWQSAVQQIYDAGFREVSISPLRFYTPGTGVIATTSSSAPTLSHIEAGIVRAKQLGMRVTLNPFVEPQGFSTWRGFYNPTPGSAEAIRFWSDYQQYLVDVATLAQTHQVDAMNVGTELKAIVNNGGNLSNWNNVIQAVDAVYTGSLGYAANWDNFKSANLTAAIWDHPAIDYLGIDAYFRIISTGQADQSGNDPDPVFITTVANAWLSQLDTDIRPFAGARKMGQGMPVVFTEYGATPFNRGIAQQPNTNQVDQAEQRMGFEALLRALDGRQDELSALHLWQWGLPGAEGSHFYTNPNVNSNINGGFDESLNTPLAQWLSSFVNNPLLRGDFDQDGLYACADVDELVAAVASATPDVLYDLDDDLQVDSADVSRWRALAGAVNLPSQSPYPVGDANLDGVVDGSDFNIWNANKFTNQAAWCKGDFTADGIVDGSDFNAWNSHKFTTADGAAAVPEPVAGTVALALLAGLGVTRRLAPG